MTREGDAKRGRPEEDEYYLDGYLEWSG